MYGVIVLAALLSYQSDMASVPNDDHCFYDVDHHLMCDRYATPTLASWLEYQGQIKECGTDCQIVDVNFGDERFIMIARL